MRESPWIPTAHGDYEVIDFADFGDRQSDPFVAKNPEHAGSAAYALAYAHDEGSACVVRSHMLEKTSHAARSPSRTRSLRSADTRP